MSEAQTERLEAIHFARQAAQHITEDNFDAARELLTDGTGKTDRYAAGFQVFGDLLVREGDTEQAMERYERALALDPQNPRLLLSLGKLYLAEHPERAQDLFWRALRYEPGVPELEAALREAIGQMEQLDKVSIPDDEPMLADEDALAALTEQPTETDFEPQSFDIPDDESTAELETIAMPLGDIETPAPLADTILKKPVDTDDTATQTDDDLDLSDMTKAALADLDLPEGTGEIPIETSTFTDIGSFEDQFAGTTEYDGFEESTPEFDLDELIESEPVESATDDDNDLSMLAADIDMDKPPAQPSASDINELPDEDLLFTEPDIAPEQPITDQAPEPAADSFEDTAVEELVTGFEDDDSDLAFLVGGDQQGMTAVEPPEEDIEPVETPTEQMETFTIAEEPDETTEPELPEIMAGEDVHIPEPVEETDTSIELPAYIPDDITDLKPTDSIEIGPDALAGSTIDIGPEDLPADFFDTELDTIPETQQETEPEPLSESTADIEPELPAEELETAGFDIVPEQPLVSKSEPVEAPPIAEPPVPEEPAAIEPESELEMIPPGPAGITEPEPAIESQDTPRPTQAANYSALLAGMDLSGIEEDSTGMTGGILEFDEEELSGLSFDESTSESVEEPVLSAEERIELSELEKMLSEDTEPPEEPVVDFSFGTAADADESDVVGAAQETESGIDYSDILAGETAGDEIDSAETVSRDESIDSYEQMLAELSGMGTEPLPTDTVMAFDEPPAEPARMDQPPVNTEDEPETTVVEPEPPQPDLEALPDEDESGDEESGTVEDLMKGTMSLRLDLSGEDASAVDDSSLDSLITDYMSALQTFSGKEHPVMPPREATEPESLEPAPSEPEDEEPVTPDITVITESETAPADIPAAEFGVVAAEPFEPHEATATMAEIFARQGLLSRAVDIYRRIVERAPDDMKARSRLEELTRQLDEATDGQ